MGILDFVSSFVGVVAGSVVTWLVTRTYYIKASQDLETKFNSLIQRLEYLQESLSHDLEKLKAALQIVETVTRTAPLSAALREETGQEAVERFRQRFNSVRSKHEQQGRTSITFDELVNEFSELQEPKR